MSHSLATAGLDKLLIRSPRWAGMALADLLPLDNSVRGHRSHRSVTYWVTAVTAGQRHPSAAGPGPATSRLTVTYATRDLSAWKSIVRGLLVVCFDRRSCRLRFAQGTGRVDGARLRR